MSRASNRGRETDPERTARWWKIAAPCALVFGMLLLGALLSTHAVDQPRVTVFSDPGSLDADPAELAARDLERLVDEPNGWTLQFMVACEESTLRPLIEQLEGEPDVFVLPHQGAGEGCYRICWGRFRTKQAAQRPRIYPEPLRAVGGPPWPVAISDVLP